MADDLYKRVKIDDEDFSVKKFTSKQALQVIKMLFSKFSALIPYIDGSKESNGQALLGVMSSLDNISDEELDAFVDKCLRNCYKVLPAGMQAVMDSAGNYGIEGFEYELLKTIQLCVEVCKWSCACFFDEKGSDFLSQIVGLIG